MQDVVVLNGKQYTLLRSDPSGKGPRKWEKSARPGQPGDPGNVKVAEWNVSGPNLFSYEGEDGYLGVDYTDGVDTRFDSIAMLGPALTSVDLSTGDTLSPTAANGIVLTGTLNATNKYLYIIRGREPKKVKLTSPAGVDTFTPYDSGFNLAETATGILYTRTPTGTEEISLGMDATAYEVVSAVGDDAAADTHSANNEAKQIEVFGVSPDRIVGIKRSYIYGNVLSGAVTMDASAWADISQLAGYNPRAKSFAMDGDQYVLGFDIGPFQLNGATGDWFPVLPEMALSSSDFNCLNMQNWSYLGTLVPLVRATRYQRLGYGESWGPEKFRENTSPVTGPMTAFAGTDYWGYCTIWNPYTSKSYLCAILPRQPGEPHQNPISFFVLRELSSMSSSMLSIDSVNGVLASPWIAIGHGSDLRMMRRGRTFREYTDTAYEFHNSADAYLYLTELRRGPGLVKDLLAAEFESDDCVSTDRLLELQVQLDQSATWNRLNGSLADNGIVYTDGQQRLHFVDDNRVPHSWATGYRIKPRIRFRSAAATASPRVIGKLRIYYLERPVTTDVYTFSLLLEENDYNGTVEEQQDRLIALWSTAPVTVEDPDNDTYYGRVIGVKVSEIKDAPGSPDRQPGGVRVAEVTMLKHPTEAGS